ncbi:hypothetical protein JTB14_031306 [Gonioctena quinquepunctata]|nr:hypothetical protein JTB14_031306 [Gonioctena quinquepunctata]
MSKKRINATLDSFLSSDLKLLNNSLTNQLQQEQPIKAELEIVSCSSSVENAIQFAENVKVQESHIDQLHIGVVELQPSTSTNMMYVDLDNFHKREDFIEYIDCHKENYDDFTEEPVLSGDVLAKTVLHTLNKYGLDLQNCVAIDADVV